MTVEDIEALSGHSSKVDAEEEEAISSDTFQRGEGTAEDFTISSKRRRRIEIPRQEQKNQRNSAEVKTDGRRMNLLYKNNFRSGGVEFAGNVKETEETKKKKRMKNGETDSKEDEDEEDVQEVKSSDALRAKENGFKTTAKDKEETAALEKENEEEENVEEEKRRRNIKSIADLVNGKIKFLSEGRPPVSGVQAMAIQLEVRGRCALILFLTR